ncbi:MAG: ShlB/FhaC/HecB family hemolysin secretion/activation protein [Calothrix sp. MO_192.B10]|nr:ShlB/FhaC/HecB family hemolysin secretion/activation protein [Calothrix sp. MO_192.B10]
MIKFRRFSSWKCYLKLLVIFEFLAAFPHAKVLANSSPEVSLSNDYLLQFLFEKPEEGEITSVQQYFHQLPSQKKRKTTLLVNRINNQSLFLTPENLNLSYEKSFLNPDILTLKRQNSLTSENKTLKPNKLSTTSNLILAQVNNPPNPITPTPPKPPVPIPQPSPPPPLEETPPTPPDSQIRPDIPGTIKVTKFEFEGNTAFSDEELIKNKKIAEFLNKPITFAELLQIETIVTNIYTEAGYINSGAFIPAEQALSPEGAVVKIQIVEGGIEDIKITGIQRLKTSYVRSRIKLATGKPLNRNKLLQALQLLQLDPLIQNISAQLSTGSRKDLSLLEVRVIEADPFRTEFFADNGRTPSVGSFRRGVRISHRNVFGLGDGVNFTYTNTDGSDAFDLDYTVPINPRNGTVRFAGGITDTKIIEPPFDRADITGDSYYLELGFRQPIFQTPTKEFALGITLSRQESKTELLGIGFPLSAGADDDGRTKISALRFIQEYTQRSSRDILALRSQFSVGLDLFDSTTNSSSPDSRFFAWRGQGQYVRQLAPDTLLVLRSDLQFSDRELVPLEQFGVGGFQSVRGYRQDSLLTDNGFLASAEVRLPVYRAKNINGVLQVVPFVDFGVGWNKSGNSSSDTNTLVGVGMGLQWQMGNYLNIRVDYGVPLTDVDDRDRTLQEEGFYFSVNYSPF